MRMPPSQRLRVLLLATLLPGVFACKFAFSAGPNNGFDLSNAMLPVDLILHSGPRRDGIAAISSAKLIKAADAEYLQANDRVLGIEITDSAGRRVAGLQGFRFAWFAFHSDTEVYEGGQILNARAGQHFECISLSRD
jgi:hypothetical protein